MPQVLVSLADGSASIDPTGGLLSYGVLGILVVCLITGLIVPGYLYKRSEAENDRLRQLIDGKVYPIVESATRVIESSTSVQEEAIRIMNEIDPPAPRRRRSSGG